VIGVLYERSLGLVIAFAVAMQVISLPILYLLSRKSIHKESLTTKVTKGLKVKNKKD
jgi:hypothetical protein